MEYNKDKIDEMALALLYLMTFDQGNRVWKGINWDVMPNIYEKRKLGAHGLQITEKFDDEQHTLGFG